MRGRASSEAVTAGRCVCVWLRVCVWVETEHLLVENPPPPPPPDGATPVIRQTSKGPLVELPSPISILHIGRV